MEALIQALRLLQSDSFIYGTKAHGYHWNVEGILFEQFHEMFGEIYKDADGAVDTYAEWIRSFGQKAVFDVNSIYSTSNIGYDLSMDSNSPIEMLRSLLESNEKIITDLKLAFNIAAEVNEQGVANFFADRITSHEKWRWKISASLKSMGTN
jgi:starvation-inducible DNA-binding protein